MTGDNVVLELAPIRYENILSHAHGTGSSCLFGGSLLESSTDPPGIENHHQSTLQRLNFNALRF